MIMSKLHELVKKYSINIPRYTSFPAFTDWQNNITKDIWVNLLSKNLQEAISLYIHIPFCTKLCTFCACNKIVTDNYQTVHTYIQALEREILNYRKQIGFDKINVRQFHIGGGTPTFLHPAEMETLFKMLDKYFIFEDEAEKSIEAHPEFTKIEQIKVLQNHGFNRISFGIQDFTPQVQHIINRVQSYKNICNLIDFSRKSGFISVNLDFIYGLPLQNEQSIAKTLEGVKEIMPERIAYYGYAHVPWKSGTLQRKFSEADLPTPQDRISMFIQGKQGFEDLGYQAIGMDHFAQSHDELAQSYQNGTLHRNFMGYTVKCSSTLLGLGVSAISELPSAYKQNTKSVSKYYDDTTAIDTSHILTEDELQSKEKILEIMTKFQTKIEKLTPNLEIMLKDGLVTYTEGLLVATEIGKMFVRNIAAEFDVHRKNTESKRFSQSV